MCKYKKNIHSDKKNKQRQKTKKRKEQKNNKMSVHIKTHGSEQYQHI